MRQPVPKRYKKKAGTAELYGAIVLLSVILFLFGPRLGRYFYYMTDFRTKDVQIIHKNRKRGAPSLPAVSLLLSKDCVLRGMKREYS